MISPIFAYIGLSISLFLWFLGVAAMIVFVVIWIKHRNDKEPIELFIEAMNKRFDENLDKLDGINKKLDKLIPPERK